ncbi:MAG: 7-carboxy-7-deazaguanine synthase QueE [Armatimonadetes bacterium]|nr:7-carboxy-7-deazaguanine synthase QueE [Armatimonadota bacterium]
MSLFSPDRAYLTEVFSSVQGEGLLVGERQLFVRFFGCHLNCSFCDTPETVLARHPKGYLPEKFSVERRPGSGIVESYANPIDVNALLLLCREMDQPRGLHRHIALTGGEPLLHGRFLEQFAPAAVSDGFYLYLETAGDLSKALEPLLPYWSVIAMDVKLVSATKDRDLWTQHDRFLQTAANFDGLVFIKAVVTSETTEDEVVQAARLAEKHGRPLILQPVTPNEQAPTPERMLQIQAVAAGEGSDVRVIPQTHKMMAQR